MQKNTYTAWPTPRWTNVASNLSHTPTIIPRELYFERLNSIMMNTGPENMPHSNLDGSFLEDAIRDYVFKYNQTYLLEIKQLPHSAWHNNPTLLPKIFAFCLLGTTPVRTNKKKMQTRATPVTYMNGTDPTDIMAINIHTQQYEKIRTVYFNH